MADNIYPNDEIQRLQGEIEKLSQENLLLRTEVEGLRFAKSTLKKRKIARWAGAGIFLGKRLVKSLEKLYTEIPQKQVTRETLAAVTAHVLWRFTRINIIGILFALIPASVLIVQTIMMQRQTTMMQNQSALMATQNSLMETQNNLVSQQIGSEDRNTKKGIYSGIVDNIEGQINSNSVRFKNEGDVLNFGKRIAAAANKLEPYELGPTGQNVSPELGQILLALSNKANRESTLKRYIYLVYGEASFNNADLEGMVFNDASFRGVNLNNANMTKTVLRGADLENAKLNQAVLDEAIITNADLFTADLSSVSAKGTLFNASKMKNAKFQGADLTGADFRGVNDMNGADFTEAILLNVKVSSDKWIRNMDGQDIKGWGDIKSKYRVNPSELKDSNGTYFVIEER